MEVFGALSILSGQRLFLFEQKAVDILHSYLENFGPNDEYENQFRSNIGSVAAAELAVLREVLNPNRRTALPKPVLEVDAKVAILTADTLRTRPCRTAALARTGQFSIFDLFMFSGEASKAFFPLVEGEINLTDFDSPEGMLRLRERLYGRRLEWERQNLSELIEAGLDKFAILFAFIRMNVIRNQQQDKTLEGVLYLQRSLNLFVGESNM
jgi:hypothetical protein